VFTRREITAAGAAFALALAGCVDGGFEDARESVLGTEERGTIVGTYDDGVERLDAATRRRDEGTVAFNDERLDDALETFDRSLAAYADAAESFREAESMADDAAVPPATAICAEAAVHAETMRESTEAARRAAAADDAGEPADVINDNVEAAQELQTEAERSRVADAEELLDVLEAEE